MESAGRGIVMDFMMSFRTEELLMMSNKRSEKKGEWKKPSTEHANKITWFRNDLADNARKREIRHTPKI